MSSLMKQCLQAVTRPGSICQDIARQSSNYVRRSQLKYGPAAQVVKARQPWSELLVKEAERQKSLPTHKEPHLLNAICRIRPLHGRPRTEKEIIKKLGVEEQCHKWQIHKNTPSVNWKIGQVKHLLRVVPVSFPHGYPEEDCDFDNCYLKSNGEFIVKKKVTSVGEQEIPKRLEEDDEKRKWQMDMGSLKKYNRQVLTDYNLNVEHFPARYSYKNNQDGKEYRYKHNMNPRQKTKHI